ncbi:SRPBCC family protein [Jeotgalibacillus terrae]|uniref:SRPBCC family protein n=1 Tax=Jeotgalibacillus terrae TaxID=587735 RepID=A0ABW5ZEL2_9BACL|nr:SRPBCC family protein [Jeotgalibacillus terrae]MBM7579032.1 putative membrane protein [Jeotgalibacillus terrae]
MGALNQTMVIERPLETVFQETIQMEKSPEIMDQVVSIKKLTDGPPAKGTRYEEVRDLGGRKVQSELVVTEFVENKSYAVTSEQNGVKINFRYTFSAEGENSTFVTFDGKITTQGFARSLFRGMIVRMISKEELFHLQKLKNYIESRTEGQDDENNN